MLCPQRKRRADPHAHNAAMTAHDDEALLAVRNARQALREDRRSDARKWAEHAARLAPQMEDPWLILAAIASPQASLQFIQRALKINPDSPRARRGMEWALERLREQPAEAAETQQSSAQPLPAAPGQPAAAATPEKSWRSLMRWRGSAPVAVLLIGIGLLVCIAAAASALSSPVVASMLRQQVQPTQAASWALAYIPKPTYTARSPVADVLQPTIASDAVASPTAPLALPTDLPPATEQPTEALSEQPTEMPTAEATTEAPTVEPTPGTLEMTFVEN